MTGRELSASLRNGKRVYGTCVLSTSPFWPDMIASLGVDYVFIDTEHVPLQREQLCWICRAYNALGVPPIVRIHEPDPYQACIALDAGAAGVIAPYVETPAQVRALRGAVKLRPLKGRRLDDALDGREIPAESAAYLNARNVDRVMVINIESVPAIEALDEILAVPDLDALLVGPHDLSINLGVPEQYQHPKFLEAISTIISKGRAANVGVGLHYSENIEHEIAWAKEGANFIVHSSDFSLVHKTLTRDFAYFKQALGDTIGGKDDTGVVV